MPAYKYKCHECDIEYEITRPISKYNPNEPCPNCGKAGKRVIELVTIHWGVGFERNRKTPLRPDGSRKLASKMWNKRTND